MWRWVKGEGAFVWVGELMCITEGWSSPPAPHWTKDYFWKRIQCACLCVPCQFIIRPYLKTHTVDHTDNSQFIDAIKKSPSPVIYTFRTDYTLPGEFGKSRLSPSATEEKEVCRVFSLPKAASMKSVSNRVKVTCKNTKTQQPCYV